MRTISICLKFAVFLLLISLCSSTSPLETQDNYPLYENDCSVDFPEISVKKWRELDLKLDPKLEQASRMNVLGDFVGSLFQRRFTKITINATGLLINDDPFKVLVGRFADRPTNKLFHPEVKEFSYTHRNSVSAAKDNILPLIHEIVRKFRSIKNFALDLGNNQPIYSPIYFTDYYQQPSKSPIFSAFQHVKTLEKFSLNLNNWLDITALELSWFGHTLKDSLTYLELSLGDTQFDAASLARMTPQWTTPLENKPFTLILNFKNQESSKLPDIIKIIEKIMTRAPDSTSLIHLELNLQNTGITKTSELDQIFTAIFRDNAQYSYLSLDISHNSILPSDHESFIVRLNDIKSYFTQSPLRDALILNFSYCNLYSFDTGDWDNIFEISHARHLEIDFSGNLDITSGDYYDSVDNIENPESFLVETFIYRLSRTYDDCSNQDYSNGNRRMMEIINLSFPKLRHIVVDFTNDDKVVSSVMLPLFKGTTDDGTLYKSHFAKTTAETLLSFEVQLGGTEIADIDSSDIPLAIDLKDLTINLSNTPFVADLTLSSLLRIGDATSLEKLNLDFSNLNVPVTGTSFNLKLNAAILPLVCLEELRLNFDDTAFTQAELEAMLNFPSLTFPLKELHIGISNVGDYDYEVALRRLLSLTGYNVLNYLKITAGNNVGSKTLTSYVTIIERIANIPVLKTLDLTLNNISEAEVRFLMEVLMEAFPSLEIFRFRTNIELCDQNIFEVALKTKIREVFISTSYVEP